MGQRANRLGTGLQPMQASPWHAGLAGLRFLRLLFASRFSAMLLSPSFSASGKAADLWKIPPTSILVSRNTIAVIATHDAAIDHLLVDGYTAEWKSLEEVGA
jgi:hypothetical protein